MLRRDARLAALQQGDSASIALTEQLVATRAELSRANAQVSALERAGFELQSLLDRARAAAVASDAEYSTKVQAMRGSCAHANFLMAAGYIIDC
jgi:hypothetical protein